jgi:hypothetical protein
MKIPVINIVADILCYECFFRKSSSSYRYKGKGICDECAILKILEEPAPLPFLHIPK